MNKYFWQEPKVLFILLKNHARWQVGISTQIRDWASMHVGVWDF